MEQPGSHAGPASPPDDTTADAAAVRDAAAILARAETDEAAANAARDRLRTQRTPELEPDVQIAPLLASDEHLLAVRHSVVVDRRLSGPSAGGPLGIGGDLYVTERRLVLVGRANLSIDLDQIEEVGLSGERLLLVMRDGTGVSLDVEQPRLLRVEIASARASARG